MASCQNGATLWSPKCFVFHSDFLYLHRILICNPFSSSSNPGPAAVDRDWVHPLPCDLCRGTKSHKGSHPMGLQAQQGLGCVSKRRKTMPCCHSICICLGSTAHSAFRVAISKLHPCFLWSIGSKPAPSTLCFYIARWSHAWCTGGKPCVHPMHCGVNTWFAPSVGRLGGVDGSRPLPRACQQEPQAVAHLWLQETLDAFFHQVTITKGLRLPYHAVQDQRVQQVKLDIPCLSIGCTATNALHCLLCSLCSMFWAMASAVLVAEAIASNRNAPAKCCPRSWPASAPSPRWPWHHIWPIWGDCIPYSDFLYLHRIVMCHPVSSNPNPGPAAADRGWVHLLPCDLCRGTKSHKGSHPMGLQAQQALRKTMLCCHSVCICLKSTAHSAFRVAIVIYKCFPNYIHTFCDL